MGKLARAPHNSVHSKKIYTACQRHTQGSVREEMLTFRAWSDWTSDLGAADVKIFEGLHAIPAGAGTSIPEERFLMHVPEKRVA